MNNDKEKLPDIAYTIQQNKQQYLKDYLEEHISLEQNNTTIVHTKYNKQKID